MKFFTPQYTFTLLCITITSLQAYKSDIFLYNNYGTSIIYKENGQNEKIIGNYAKIKLSSPGSILIRTNRYLSSFTDITPLLETIQQQAHSHQNDNIVIYINPSSAYQSWNITTEWETNEPTDITALAHWPNTTAKQIEFIHNLPCDEKTKIYILQLLWWSLENSLLSLNKKSAAQRKKDEAQRKRIVSETISVIQALKVYNATAPAIRHTPGIPPKPLLTYTNITLPNYFDEGLQAFIARQLQSFQ
jgi:hypothetical protein